MDFLTFKYNREEFFEFAYKNYFKFTYRYAYKLFQSQSNANDATQEAFCILYKSLVNKKVTFKNESMLKGWLATVINNLFIEHCRKKVTTLPIEEQHLLESNDNSRSKYYDYRLDASEHMLRHIQKEKIKKTIEMFFYEDKTIRQISNELETPEGTISTRLSDFGKKVRMFVNKRKAL